MEAVIRQNLTDDVYFPVWVCMYMFGSISCSDKTPPESAVLFQPTSSARKMVLLNYSEVHPYIFSAFIEKFMFLGLVSHVRFWKRS